MKVTTSNVIPFCGLAAVPAELLIVVIQPIAPGRGAVRYRGGWAIIAPRKNAMRAQTN